MNLHLPTEAQKTKTISREPDIVSKATPQETDVEPVTPETESEVLFDQEAEIIRDAS